MAVYSLCVWHNVLLIKIKQIHDIFHGLVRDFTGREMMCVCVLWGSVVGCTNTTASYMFLVRCSLRMVCEPRVTFFIVRVFCH